MNFALNINTDRCHVVGCGFYSHMSCKYSINNVFTLPYPWGKYKYVFLKTNVSSILNVLKYKFMRFVYACSEGNCTYVFYNRSGNFWNSINDKITIVLCKVKNVLWMSLFFVLYWYFWFVLYLHQKTKHFLLNKINHLLLQYF